MSRQQYYDCMPRDDWINSYLRIQSPILAIQYTILHPWYTIYIFLFNPNYTHVAYETTRSHTFCRYTWRNIQSDSCWECRYWSNRAGHPRENNIDACRDKIRTYTFLINAIRWSCLCKSLAKIEALLYAPRLSNTLPCFSSYPQVCVFLHLCWRAVLTDIWHWHIFYCIIFFTLQPYITLTSKSCNYQYSCLRYFSLGSGNLQSACK